MPAFSLHVRNLRALRTVAWSPPPLSALVGANGVGKTTLILCLKFIRAAYDRGPTTALGQVLDGAFGLRNWLAPEGEPIEVGLDLGACRWRIRLSSSGSASGTVLEESLRAGDSTVFELGSTGLTYDRVDSGLRIPPGALALRHLRELFPDDERLEPIASFVRRITAFHDPDLWRLRANGSSTKEDLHVHSRGSNALTMLRRWHQERPERHRYQFVVETLKSAFPVLIDDIDFEGAGQTITARVYVPGHEGPTPLASLANGVLSLLVTATQIAGAEDGGVIAVDEPENALHPYAIRRLVNRTAAWAAKHDTAVLFATHSTPLLDALTPEQVYVLRSGEVHRVDELKNKEWLAQYRLGELYEEGELGENADDAR